MEINGFKLKYSAEELTKKVNNEVREICLIDKNEKEYVDLTDGDKKALDYLVNAAKIMNDVALELDHPLNLIQKQALETLAPGNEYVSNALLLFNFINGVAGYNGLDKDPVEIFEGIHMYKGCNFYPTDLDENEFHEIIIKMLDENKVDEVAKILSSRTVVRRKGDVLEAIDYTEYFSEEFSEIANEIECAAHFTTDNMFKEYLKWQAQALLQNNVEMDILADKHWVKMQNTSLEFTISRENYNDKMTPSVFSNKSLIERLRGVNINPVPKDMLGIRVGIVNKQGTNLLLKFKDKMRELVNKMPCSELYEQKISDGELKQTMVDVDIVALSGDYAMCRGGITLAQNLPNNDKPSLYRGGGRRNVYHRQVRFAGDSEKTKKILEGLVASEFHEFYDEEADHLFTIGHENGHSLGPDSSYQCSMGIFQHIIEENKADMVSAAMMPEYVKAGIITEEQLKKIYTTWIVKRHLLLAYPEDQEAHRVADLIEYNYLLDYGAIYFDQDKKLHINFDKTIDASKKLLEDIIKVQLSKSSICAKEYINRWSEWGDMAVYISDFKKKLGVKPYIRIISCF